MIDLIAIDDNEEFVFDMRDDTLEFCYNNGSMYVMSDDGYFNIEGIDDFRHAGVDSYILVDEDKNTIEFTRDEYDQISDLILKCQSGFFNKN